VRAQGESFPERSSKWRQMAYEKKFEQMRKNGTEECRSEYYAFKSECIWKDNTAMPRDRLWMKAGQSSGRFHMINFSSTASA